MTSGPSPLKVCVSVVSNAKSSHELKRPIKAFIKFLFKTIVTMYKLYMGQEL